MAKFFNYIFSSVFIDIMINSCYNFHIKQNFIISLDFSAILFDSSWIVICSGIFTSLITFLNSFFSSPSGLFFSFNLALFTDAKLLCFISISSTFRALETVSLKSLLSIRLFSLSLLLPEGLLSFLIKALVACCSINFLFKPFFNSGLTVFVKVDFF